MSLVAPPSKQELGTPTYAEEGKTILLDGSCGIAACCGVMATVSVKDDHVVWSECFCGQPELPPNLHLTFDRDQYASELSAS